MAGRGNKKSQDNFEKMKREMTIKKQKAKTRHNPETSHADIEKVSEEDIARNVQNDMKESIIDLNKIEMLVFQVDEEEFALRISNVKEIIRVPSMTKVSGAPRHIIGLCGLRGDLLPVIDSRKLFGMADKEYNESSRIIVMDIHGKKVGLVADKVSEVIDVEEAAIKEPPGSIKDIDEGVINGILLLNNGKRVVMILDAEKIIKAGNLDAVTNQQHTNTKSLYVDDADNNLEHIVVFKLGEEEYGIEINNVQEINRMSEIVHFPGAPVFIAGMVYLRGDMIPVLNLRRLFAFHDSDSYNTSKFLVVKLENKRIGIMIDSASEVLRFSKVYLEETPKVLDGNDHDNYIDKIAKLNDGKRIILILNLLAVLSFM